MSSNESEQQQQDLFEFKALDQRRFLTPAHFITSFSCQLSTFPVLLIRNLSISYSGCKVIWKLSPPFTTAVFSGVSTVEP